MRSSDSAHRRLVLDHFVTADDAAKRQIARVIRHLEALDRTHAWALTAHSSLYEYCMEARGWSRGQTGIRVQVAHVGRRVPRVFDMLEAGELSVSSASLLAPKLTDLGRAATDELLDDARGLSKRALEELLAARFPKPDVADSVRKVPQPRTPAPTPELLALVAPQTTTPEVSLPTSTGRGRKPAPSRVPVPAVRRERVQPLAVDRFKVQLTVSRATRDKLQAVQALMSHKKGTGLEQVLEQALGLLHDKLLKEKFGVGRRRRKSKKPEAEAKPSESASVPVAVRAEVYQRDGGACTYVDPETGQRCGERRWLQLDHIVPRCRGGSSTAANLRCLCASHNRLMARQILGDTFMDQKLARAPDGDRGHPR